MRVSVIVANYNYGRYITKTLRSLMEQSMPSSEYEIIVIDDNSNDISMKLLEAYLDSIRLIKAEEHHGVIALCNEGFRKARGQFIVRVDADDYVNRNLLEVESLFLQENKGFDAVACDYYKVNESGDRLVRFDAQNHTIACGVMFRREVLEKGYLEDGNMWEDVEYVRRLNTYFIPLPLYRYRQHNGSLTHKEKNGTSDCRTWA